MRYLLSILILVLLSCQPEDKWKGEVTYEVEASKGGFDVTYDDGGSTIQKEVSSDYWSSKHNAELGDWTYVSAQAGNYDTKITVKAFYNGSLIDESTSEGDFVIATAKGKAQ